MKQIHLRSIPLIHAPGIVDWLRSFDEKNRLNAIEIMAAAWPDMGLDVAVRILRKAGTDSVDENDTLTFTYDETTDLPHLFNRPKEPRYG